MKNGRLDMSIYGNPMYAGRERTDRLLEMPMRAESAGTVYRTAGLVARKQLKNTVLWKVFVEMFRTRPDAENGGWRGEYWGKMMRGACFVFRVTRDEELYSVIREAVIGLLDTADPDGRISSYPRDKEFFGWDMWCRKYVLLGLEYFWDICPEETLRNRITAALCAHMGYIISKVGPGEGKMSIVDTSTAWGGINSCSILEPTVKLYSLTGDERYLDFAKYIVGTGGCKLGDVFELALNNEIPPYKYPVVKAYETMSFFEGVAELYRVTLDERYLRAVVNFTDAVLKTDYTVIGCSGCTHELFDNSSSEVQTEARLEIMQETCVSVTLSKLLFRVFSLTGDPKYADAIETTYYNSILGSVNFGGCDALERDPVFGKGDYHWSDEFVKRIGGFMFDSYAPLYKSFRNRKVGGYMRIEGGRSYGCCACIGSLGTAILPLSAVMISADGKTVFVSQYTDGKFEYRLPGGGRMYLAESTDYPWSPEVVMEISFTGRRLPEKIALRIPSYGDATVFLDGKRYKGKAGSFLGLPVPGDREVLKIKAVFDLSAKVILLGGKAAVKKGCVVLAADCRSADIDSVASSGIRSDRPVSSPFPSRMSRRIVFSNGTKIDMVDFSSAGADWNAPRRYMTVWLDT